MRKGELRTLRWANVDIGAAVLTVGRSKTEGGEGRRIPLNQELQGVLDSYRSWYVERFGEARPDWYLFPWGANGNHDPSRPIGSIKTAWNTIRRRSGVQCRFHDLRHTAATKPAEAGVAESTMLAIMGHMSRAMLERYSHIRMQAKRDAVEALSLRGEPVQASLSTKVSTVEDIDRIQ